jgi:hypothetical protein
MAKKLLSGIKPTGQLHLGNYFGAIKQFVDFQDLYESNIFIADLHAITSIQNKEILSKNTLDIAIDFLSIGIIKLALINSKYALFASRLLPAVDNAFSIAASNSFFKIFIFSHNVTQKVEFINYSSIITNLLIFIQC